MLAGLLILTMVAALLWTLTPPDEASEEGPVPPGSPAEEQLQPTPSVSPTTPPPEDPSPAYGLFPEPSLVDPRSRLAIDLSGAAATGGTPLPDFAGAVPGDDEAARLPLGTVTELTYPERLDFLRHHPGSDYRDAAFVHPDDPSLVTSAWQADRPFVVRHGFVNEATEPLGDGFDVVVYVHRFGRGDPGVTLRFTSDYVLRGEADSCGPKYLEQTDPVTCEWFVHDFDEGLPEGRHALWAVWEAPCRAWVEYGFAYTCEDPGVPLALFASGVDSPWEPGPITWEHLD